MCKTKTVQFYLLTNQYWFIWEEAEKAYTLSMWKECYTKKADKVCVAELVWPLTLHFLDKPQQYFKFPSSHSTLEG